MESSFFPMEWGMVSENAWMELVLKNIPAWGWRYPCCMWDCTINVTDHLGHYYIRMKDGLAMAPAHVRTRFKLHHGSSHAQVQEQLLTYGIPINAIPIVIKDGEDDASGIDLLHHLRWLDDCLKREQKEDVAVANAPAPSSSSKMMIEPTHHARLKGGNWCMWFWTVSLKRVMVDSFLKPFIVMIMINHYSKKVPIA